jgi:type IV pilus assembly protein PilM
VEGVLAARSDAADAPVAAVARVALDSGAVQPAVKPGNLADRFAVVAALRKALEDIGLRGSARGADVTLVVPDAAARVLLLDFDSLPGKLTEALPIVRFRLKKLLPFDADEAMISYQVMSQTRQMVRVLAVAMPRDVLAEYESAAREAGFEPGSVLPSTLAAVAALGNAGAAELIVNAHSAGVTTAIVSGGLLLLHRTVDLQAAPAGVPTDLPAALFESSPENSITAGPIAIVDPDDTAGEWAAQEPLPEYGAAYSLAESAERAVQGEDAVTGLRIPPVFVAQDTPPLEEVEPVRMLAVTPQDASADVAEAINVAAAYFEDTLSQMPQRILSAGPMGAEQLQSVLAGYSAAGVDGLRVRELVTPEALLPDAVTASVSRGWMAGVVGALRG